MKLRDRFWLWGHPEGRYNNNAANFGFFDESRMTLYTREFGVDKAVDEDFQLYIDVFDGIVMWTWKASDVPLIPEKWKSFKTMATKKRMLGCYLWNFGESKPATREAVLWQLDFYREKILLGEAEGVVLHTNVMADADLDSFDAAREWMRLHRDEEVADI